MTYIPPKTLTKEDFLFQSRDNPRYELADGDSLTWNPLVLFATVYS